MRQADFYLGAPKATIFQAASDAAFADDAETRHLSYRYVFLLYNGVID